MKAFLFTIRIDRPADVVWKLATDLSKSSAWRPLVQRMSTPNGAPLMPGTPIDVTVELMGRAETRQSLTTVFDPPRRWVLRSEEKGIVGEFDLRVESADNGCVVSYRCDVTTRRILWWLVLPLVARNSRRLRARQLENLKRLAESSPVA